MKSSVKCKKKKVPYYTVYSKATEEVLYFGTIEQLVSKGVFKNKRVAQDIFSKIRKGRIKDKEVCVELIDDRDI